MDKPMFSRDNKDPKGYKNKVETEERPKFPILYKTKVELDANSEFVGTIRVSAADYETIINIMDKVSKTLLKEILVENIRKEE